MHSTFTAIGFLGIFIYSLSPWLIFFLKIVFSQFSSFSMSSNFSFYLLPCIQVSSQLYLSIYCTLLLSVTIFTSLFWVSMVSASRLPLSSLFFLLIPILALPFLHNTVFFIYPTGLVIFVFILSLFFNFNFCVFVMNLYFGK